MKYNILLDATIEPKNRDGTSYTSSCEVSNTENIADTVADMIKHTEISGIIQDVEIYIYIVKE